MTAVHHYTLRCDHQDCWARYGDAHRLASIARAAGARRGWTTTGSVVHGRRVMLDLCPLHGQPLADWLALDEYPVVGSPPCACDARPLGRCYAHLSPDLWRAAARAAAKALLTDAPTDAVVGVVVRVDCLVEHARIVLRALGVETA